MQVFNSGLEVWLYDDANGDHIREQRVRRTLICGGKTDGQIVGYSLQQDDALSVDVVVGAPLNDAELIDGEPDVMPETLEGLARLYDDYLAAALA